ncbi:Lysine-specific demethylase 8, partial [Rhizopus stolonifer]
GSKYIKLISPEQSSYVYPRDGLMNNTSQVDVEHPDTHLYPLFDRVQYVECVLEEGQVLYVPPKWWHFVKSLDISFSVSLWF